MRRTTQFFLATAAATIPFTQLPGATAAPKAWPKAAAPKSVVGQLQRARTAPPAAAATLLSEVMQQARARKDTALLELAGHIALSRGVEARDKGDLAGAKALLVRGLSALNEVVPGSEHVAYCLLNLGQLVDEQGQTAAAEKYLRRSLAVYQIVGADTPRLANCLESLGSTLQKLGKHREAAKLLERAVGIYETAEPDSPALARALARLLTGAHHPGVRFDSSRLR